MTVEFVELSRIIRIHYGAALKEEDRVQAGNYEVFGSSGLVGHHTEALFDYPSIIIGRKGSVGSITYAPRGGWAIDTTFFVERLEPQNCDPRYLYYVLSNAKLAKHTITTSIPGLSRDDIYRTRVRLPSVAEQRRIAGILDKADAIRRKLKGAIVLTQELLRSTFLEMFGDPVTNPQGWPTESIEMLCARGASLVDGPFGSSLKPEHYVSNGVKVVRNWNIYDDRFDDTEFKYITIEKFNELRRSEVFAGDILITTKGTVGDVCIAPELHGPAVLSASGTMRLRLPPDNTYLPGFLVAQMTNPSFKRYLHTFVAGSAQQYLNLSAVKKMMLLRPPTEIQEKFSSFRGKVRLMAKKENTALAEANALFDTLLMRSFGGNSET